MSLERVIKTLIGLGLSRRDAEVYVYLAKKVSLKVDILTSALNYSKNQIYTSLGILAAKALVNKDGITFSAIPFEEALELLINQEKQKAEAMGEIKKEILANWQIIE